MRLLRRIGWPTGPNKKMYGLIHITIQASKAMGAAHRKVYFFVSYLYFEHGSLLTPDITELQTIEHAHCLLLSDSLVGNCVFAFLC
jgi:hypothetical protein